MVENLGWFQTTFAMAGRTCREAVERVPSTRAVLTEEERERLQSWTEVPTAEEIRRLQSQGMTLAVAAVEGDVEALEWLIQLFDAKGLEWRSTYDGTELSGLAAKRGKLESLTCLRANGWPWDGMTCMRAAEGGHLEVLQWARQKGCMWEESTCKYAAEGGHLEVLQWARENRCKWCKRTCSAAAKGGHLLVLQWARQNECPWNVVPVEQVDVRIRGCPRRTQAGQGGQVLQWARQNGCPWNKDAKGGHVRMGARAQLRRREGTWRCCSGRVRTGARWTRGRAGPRQREGAWMCCSGRVRTGTRGTRARANTRRREGTWRFCGGRIRTDARWTADVLGRGVGRAPGGVAVGASERVPVGRKDVRGGGAGRPPGGVAVGA